MRICKFCGAKVADDSRFCSECGKETLQTHACPHCGADIGESDAFCQNCGKGLKHTKAPIEEKTENGIKKYLPFIVGGVVVFGVFIVFSVIIVCLLFFKGNEGPKTDVTVETKDSVHVTPSDNPLYGLAKIAAEYDYIESFHEGLAGIMKNNKVGVVNTKGEIIVSPMYDKSGYHDKHGYWFQLVYQEGLAAVKKNGKYGFIDKTGKEVVSCQYDFVRSFSEGLAVVSRNSRCGYIDKSGKEVIPLKYDNAFDFYNGTAKVISDDLFGFIDKKGNEIVPLVYESLGDNVSDGLISAWKDGKAGFVDMKGNEIIPFIYSSVSDFSEGLAAVETEGKWGYISKNGEMILPAIYDNADKFIDGVAVVYQNENYGIINKKGQEVQPFIYDYYNKGTRSEGLILIGKNEKMGIVDAKGHEVVPFVYAYGDVENSLEGYIMIKKDQKYGFQDKAGKIVIPCEYDKVGLLLEGIAAVEKDGVRGYVDIHGHSTFEIVSDDMSSPQNSVAERKQEADLNQFIGEYTYSYFYNNTNTKLYFRISLKQDGSFTHEPANDQTKGVVEMETVVDGKDYPTGGTWKVKDTSVGKAVFLDFDGSWGEGSITPDKSVIEIKNMNGYNMKSPLHSNN